MDARTCMHTQVNGCTRMCPAPLRAPHARARVGGCKSPRRAVHALTCFPRARVGCVPTRVPLRLPTPRASLHVGGAHACARRCVCARARGRAWAARARRSAARRSRAAEAGRQRGSRCRLGLAAQGQGRGCRAEASCWGGRGVHRVLAPASASAAAPGCKGACRGFLNGGGGGGSVARICGWIERGESAGGAALRCCCFAPPLSPPPSHHKSAAHAWC